MYDLYDNENDLKFENIFSYLNYEWMLLFVIVCSERFRTLPDQKSCQVRCCPPLATINCLSSGVSFPVVLSW